MQGPGQTSVEPQTVQAGETVHVSYSGSGELQYRVDGGPWTPVPVDPKTGKGQIQAPAGAAAIFFWDRDHRDPSSGVTVEVVSASP